jgi:hypothetical protein
MLNPKPDTHHQYMGVTEEIHSSDIETFDCKCLNFSINVQASRVTDVSPLDCSSVPLSSNSVLSAPTDNSFNSPILTAYLSSTNLRPCPYNFNISSSILPVIASWVPVFYQMTLPLCICNSHTLPHINLSWTLRSSYLNSRPTLLSQNPECIKN